MHPDRPLPATPSDPPQQAVLRVVAKLAEEARRAGLREADLALTGLLAELLRKPGS